MDKDEIKSWFESRRGELVALAGRLIAARTVNPPGDEHRAAEVIERYLEPLGIASTRHEKESGRTNLVARIGSGSPKVIVAGHVDTVPAGDGWETDPFSALEKDQKLYGRGSADDKGPTASMLLAGRWLKEHEEELSGEVVLIAAADEERGSRLGMKYLLAEGIVAGDWAIIPDAGGAMRTIFIAEKAAFFSTLTSYGKQAHGSKPEEGVNAIKGIMEVLRRIDKMQFDVTRHRLLTPPTYNLGMIQGGVAPNVVPAKCTAELDIRFLPGDSAEAITKKIEDICRDVEKEIPGARFEFTPRTVDMPMELPEDHPLVRAITEETEATLGTAPKPAGLSGSTVAKFCMQRGIPAVNFAPGDGGCAHMANEFASIDSLVSFAHVLTRIILRLLK